MHWPEASAETEQKGSHSDLFVVIGSIMTTVEAASLHKVDFMTTFSFVSFELCEHITFMCKVLK